MGRNPIEDEFRNSYSYKVAKELEKGVNQVARGVENVVREVTEENETRPNYRRTTTTTRTTYNTSNNSYSQNYNNRNYGHNYDPNTGRPINHEPPRNEPPINININNNINDEPFSRRKERQRKWPSVVLGLIAFRVLAEIWYSDAFVLLGAAAIGVGAYFASGAIKKWWKKRKEDKAHQEYIAQVEEEAKRQAEKVKAEEKAKEQVRKAEEQAAKKEAEKEAAKKRAEVGVKQTGDPELDKVIDEGNEYIIALREANDAIPGEEISNTIDRIEKACKGIFEYIREHPSKTSEIKKFMNYYLPTTLKLLKSYETLQNQTYKGDTISSTMFDIEGMMVTIASAFEKKLDQLFESDSMDIAADIEVFENLLASEGLTDDGKQITMTK